MPTYDYECLRCGNEFEDQETIVDRNNSHKCPKCKCTSKRVQSLVSFNTVFPGSTRAEMLADKLTADTVAAQDEGFTSKDEMQAAEGMAKERAKQMGYGDRQLIGAVRSPYVGDHYVPDKGEQETKTKMGQKVVEAAMAGKVDKVIKGKREMAEHEKHLKTQASKTKREFKPDRDATALKKAVKDSQSRRGSALS